MQGGKRILLCWRAILVVVVNKATSLCRLVSNYLGSLPFANMALHAKVLPRFRRRTVLMMSTVTLYISRT